MAPKSAVLEEHDHKPHAETIACLHVELKDLVDAPGYDARDKPSADSVRELARTIELYGQLHPMVVMKAPGQGKYYLLAGRRRRAALELLGKKGALAHELRDLGDGAEELGRRVQIVENTQRAELDPVKEAEVVNLLLEDSHATVETVAADLGRSVSWVMNRAKLVGLSKAVKAERKRGGLLDGWPTAWLEQLAYMTHDDQAAILDLQRNEWSQVRSLAVLRQVVRQRLQGLASAPWKLEDETLVKGEPSCVKCTRHSAARPELFPEEGAVEVKKARCLETSCFTKKLAAWTTRAIAEAKAAHGDQLELVAGMPRPEFGPRHGFKNGELLDAAEEVILDMQDKVRNQERDNGKASAPPPRPLHEFKEVKKTEKGAKPVLIIEGVEAGKIKWVKERSASDKARSGQQLKTSARPAMKAKPLTLAEKRKALALRRHKHVLRAVQKQVDEWRDDPKKLPAHAIKNAANEPQWLLDLVACFGCEERTLGLIKKNDLGDVKNAAKLFDVGGFKYDGNASVLPRVLSSFLQTKLDGFQYSKDLTDDIEWARLLYCQALELKDEWKALVTVAEAELPEPQAWGAATSPAKSAAKVKSKANKTDKAISGKLKVLEDKLAKAKAPKKKERIGKDAAAGEREEN